MRNMLKEMKDAGYELVEMSEEDEEESFKDIDTDGDGSISEEEFGVIVVE
jgi:Ca2+-binding EF-hand superfamily protein